MKPSSESRHEQQLLRKLVRQRIKSLPAIERMRISERLLQELEAHPRFIEAKVVLLFHSLPDEPFTHDFIRKWQERKKLLLPVVTGSETMELRTVSPQTPCSEGAYHIYEPQGAPFTDYAALQLAVVPGVVFDPHGMRIGRGKGYYDRFLSRPALRHVFKIGLCFPIQVVPHIEPSPHDIPMNDLIPAVKKADMDETAEGRNRHSHKEK